MHVARLLRGRRGVRGLARGVQPPGGTTHRQPLADDALDARRPPA